MNPVPDKIELFKPGSSDPNSFSASVMNKIVTLLNALRNAEVENHEATWSENNVVFSKKDKSREGEAEITPIEVEQMMVTAVYPDYLHCKRCTWNGTYYASAGDTIRVAKPDELRYRIWNEFNSTTGYTVNGWQFENPDDVTPETVWVERVATIADASAEFDADSIDFVEQVWPPYVAAPAVAESATRIQDTGIRESIIIAVRVKQTPLFTVTEDSTDYNVEWIDLNVAARRFEPKFKKIRICQNGQTGTWYALIRTSEAFQEL